MEFAVASTELAMLEVLRGRGCSTKLAALVMLGAELTVLKASIGRGSSTELAELMSAKLAVLRFSCAVAVA